MTVSGNVSGNVFGSTRGSADRATAFAPASVANVAVGFDLLGFSADIAGDTVTVEKNESRLVKILSISGASAPLPTDPKRNTATAGLVRLIEDFQLPFGFDVSIEKGIPFGSGMGGSAASAVAAIVAANSLLEGPLMKEQLLAYALIGEAQASGSYHADNLAPSLYGGLTLARVEHDGSEKLPSVEVTSLPIPTDLFCVLIHPQLAIETKSARGVLKNEIPLHDHIMQSALLAGVLAGCYTDDLALIGRSLKDLLIEPQRAHLITGFGSAQKAALEAGALGCTISGAGPSVFAWANGESSALRIQAALTSAFAHANVGLGGAWSFRLNTHGARCL